MGIGPGQAKICLESPRDKRDRIIVQEKLDGSNVAVANVGGEIVPIIRAGYRAINGRFEQHKFFHLWVMERVELFAFLRPGERVCGEWLAQAHGTRYTLRHGPFVAFDIMRVEPRDAPGAGVFGAKRQGKDAPAQWRVPYDEFVARVRPVLPIPECVFDEVGKSCTIKRAIEEIEKRNGHGAIDPIEGAVWRVERREKDGPWTVDFLAKFVRHEKVDGKFLPEVSGEQAVWNWRPDRGK